MLAGFALGILLMLWTRPVVPQTVTPERSADIRVLISNGFLARQVEHTTQHLGISQVTVRSDPPSRLVADAQWNSPFGAAPIEVVAQPVASDGKLSITVLSAKLAGFGIPPSVVQTIADSETGSLNRPLGKNAHVTSVRVVRQGVRLSANYATP